MIKCRFPRTNKRRYISQLAAAEVYERFMWGIAQYMTYHARLSKIKGHRIRRRKRAQAESDEDDAVDSIDSTRHYDIPDTTKEKENLLQWVHANCSDVTTKVCLAILSTHTHTNTIAHYFRTLSKDSKIISSCG